MIRFRSGELGRISRRAGGDRPEMPGEGPGTALSDRPRPGRRPRPLPGRRAHAARPPGRWELFAFRAKRHTAALLVTAIVHRLRDHVLLGGRWYEARLQSVARSPTGRMKKTGARQTTSGAFEGAANIRQAAQSPAFIPSTARDGDSATAYPPRWRGRSRQSSPGVT